MFILTLLVVSLHIAHKCLVWASSIALYNDTACSNVIDNLAAPNGYPDGQCTHFTDLKGGDTYNGIKFLTLDAGCAITLYGPDSEVCSGPTFVASLNVCYNTSWTYYSVDGCTAPSVSSSSTVLSTSKSTSTSTSTSAATVTETIAASGASASLSGGALAGVIIVAILAAAAVTMTGIYFFGRGAKRLERERRKQEIEQREKPGSAPGGLPPQYGSLGRPPLGQGGGGQPLFEANSQTFAEAPHDSRAPPSNNAELSGNSYLGELPAKPYH